MVTIPQGDEERLLISEGEEEREIERCLNTDIKKARGRLQCQF